MSGRLKKPDLKICRDISVEIEDQEKNIIIEF